MLSLAAPAAAAGEARMGGWEEPVAIRAVGGVGGKEDRRTAHAHAPHRSLGASSSHPASNRGLPERPNFDLEFLWGCFWAILNRLGFLRAI
eukprot:6797158-Pyramimonas_sp.AAC.1